ncbi:MAG: hypothetical protein O2894_11905 [Planctomycetota bacterium]|nr:hypothetical protein [Planctomycetota bacterium]
MLPTSKTPRCAAPEVRPGASTLTQACGDALRPIGPERLRALREAIRSGTYPNDAQVLGGLTRLLRAAEQAG